MNVDIISQELQSEEDMKNDLDLPSDDLDDMQQFMFIQAKVACCLRIVFRRIHNLFLHMKVALLATGCCNAACDK